MSRADEPAFPVTKVVEQRRNGDPMEDLMLVGGLSKREYFAAMAMQGLAVTWHQTSDNWTPDKQAELALKMADALIAELEKKEG